MTERGVATCDVRHVVTSLDARWSAADLLAPVREHWHIENRLHYVRDIALGEDTSCVRRGADPRVLGVLHQRRGAISPPPCVTTPGARQ